MRLSLVPLIAVWVVACSNSPAAKQSSPRDASADVDSLGGGIGVDASFAHTYRNSLGVCWTDASCPRVLAVAHGGAWNLNNVPYDSNGAIKAAYADGVDGVKLDVRVTKDNVPVIAHSSPIMGYESMACAGDRIEEMTAAQVTACPRFPTTNEHFQRLDDVLDYLRGKMVVQLTVKLSSDYARTIQQVLEQQAQDFAFLEISTSDLQNLIPKIPGSDRIYYLINVGSDLPQVDTLLGTIQNPRAFMYEFDPGVDVSTLTLFAPAPGRHPLVRVHQGPARDGRRSPGALRGRPRRRVVPARDRSRPSAHEREQEPRRFATVRGPDAASVPLDNLVGFQVGPSFPKEHA